MVSSSSPRTWPIEGTTGKQEWVWGDNRFETVITTGRSFSLRNDDVDSLPVNMGDRPNCTTCQGLLPETFSYCPNCRNTLKPVGAPASPLWNSPAGHRSGLPKFEQRIEVEPVIESFPLPAESDALAFVCAGTPRRLVAIEREHGQTFLFSTTRQCWKEIDHHEGYNGWTSLGWSAAASESGLAFPTNGPPVWVSLVGTERSVETAASNLQLSCLAGPILIDDVVYVPVATTNLLVALARRRVSGGPWTILEVNCGHDGWTPAPKFAAPVSNAARHVFWVSVNGYLNLWRDGQQDVVRWRRWLNDEQALLSVRVSRYQNDLLQIVHGADGYAYQSLVSRSRSIERHGVDGPCFSADNVHFRGLAQRDAPWGEDVVTLPWQEGFVVPLLSFPGRFAVGLWLRDFAQCDRLIKGEEARADAEFYWITPQGSAGGLDQRVRLSGLDDISLFLFGNWLHVYHASAATGWRWPCRSI